MTLRQAFGLCFSALVLAAIIALAVAEELYLYAPLGALLVGLRYHMIARGKAAHLSKLTASILTCLAFVYVGLDYRLVSHQLMLSVAHFLVVVQLVRLFESKRTRDYAFMAITAMLHLAVAMIVSLELSLALPMLVVFAAAPPVLIMLTLLLGIEQSAPEWQRGDVLLLPATETTRLPRPFWVMAFGAGLLSMAVAVLVFASVPRLQTEFFAQETLAEPLPMTGFDNEVTLADIGSIKQNIAEVMKVQIRRDGQPVKPEGIELYWRGLALEYYDGRRWMSIRTGRSTRVRAGVDRVMPLAGLYPAPLADLARGRRGVEFVQECTLQPLDTKILFGLYCMTEVQSKSFDAVNFSEQDQTVSLSSGRTNTIQYQVKSRVVPMTEQTVARLRAAKGKVPMVIRKACLRLPPNISQRVKDLGKRIAKSVRRPTQYDRTMAIENYLRNPGRFRYTLDVEGIGDREPIDAFLFERKAGHCSFFAAAMVVMLRAAGIPARMVNGFYGGEWNEFGRFYLVRQADAHSWVEVFFPGVGWVTFDPTPAGDRVGTQATGPLQIVRKYVDYLDTLWLTYVVGYDASSAQRAGLGLLAWFHHRNAAWRGAGESLPPATASTSSSAPIWGFAAMCLVGVGALVALVLAVLRLFGGWALLGPRGRGEPRPSIAFYRKFLDIMRRKGYFKGAWMTPNEFVGGLQALPPAARQSAAYLTQRFSAMRYGGETITRQEAAQVQTCLAELGALPSKPKPHRSEAPARGTL